MLIIEPYSSRHWSHCCLRYISRTYVFGWKFIATSSPNLSEKRMSAKVKQSIRRMNINVIPYLVLFENHAGFQGQVQFRLEWRFQLVVFKSWVWWFCNTQNLHEADNCFGRHVAAASSGSKWTMTTAIIPVHCLSFSHGFLATRLISGGYGGTNARKLLLGLLE